MGSSVEGGSGIFGELDHQLPGGQVSDELVRLTRPEVDLLRVAVLAGLRA